MHLHYYATKYVHLGDKVVLMRYYVWIILYKVQYWVHQILIYKMHYLDYFFQQTEFYPILKSIHELHLEILHGLCLEQWFHLCVWTHTRSGSKGYPIPTSRYVLETSQYEISIFDIAKSGHGRATTCIRGIFKNIQKGIMVLYN